MIKKKKGGSESKYCNNLPVDPQQVFYECKQSWSTIFQSSLAAAYGSVGSAASLLAIALMLIAHNLLGLKPTDEEEKRIKPPSMLQKYRASCLKKKHHSTTDNDGIEVLPVVIKAPRGTRKDTEADRFASL
jgi:hypothetical protein